MTMITPSYLGETIEYSSLHACRSTLEDPTGGTREFEEKIFSTGDTEEHRVGRNENYSESSSGFASHLVFFQAAVVNSPPTVALRCGARQPPWGNRSTSLLVVGRTGEWASR